MFLLCFTILPAFQNQAQRKKIPISEYINLGNNSILCFITFSLNKICTAWARYDYAHVGLYNFLYETDPRIGQLWNRLFTHRVTQRNPKEHRVEEHNQVPIVQQGAVPQMTTWIKNTLILQQTWGKICIALNVVEISTWQLQKFKHMPEV